MPRPLPAPRHPKVTLGFMSPQSGSTKGDFYQLKKSFHLGGDGGRARGRCPTLGAGVGSGTGDTRAPQRPSELRAPGVRPLYQAQRVQMRGSRGRGWRPQLFPLRQDVERSAAPSATDHPARNGDTAGRAHAGPTEAGAGTLPCLLRRWWSRSSSGALSFLERLLLRHLPDTEGPGVPEGDLRLEEADGPR